MDLNTVQCADCLDALRQVPAESVDMVFADPPFNIGKDYGVAKDNRPDYREWCAAWIAECFRVLKSTGSFYLMTLPRHLEWKMPLMASHGVFINLIRWRNVSATHSKRSFWNEYQPIMLYGKTTDYKFNTYAEPDASELARWTEYKTGSKRQMKDSWDDIPFVYAGSIAHEEAVLKPLTRRKEHPAQMPVKLAARCLRFSTDAGDIVLDLFSGSGTTAVAAKLNHRRFIGFEINPAFVKLANERLAQEPLPLTEN